MTRLKQFLAAVAALVVGGMALNEALKTTMGENQIDCRQMRAMARELEDVQQKRTFFLALQEVPNPIPMAHGTRVLGNCSGGSCNLAGCGLDASYTYEVVSTLGAWKLVKVFAAPYFARGWQAYAADTADVHFFGSLAEVKSACLNLFTAQQCLAVLTGASECWLQSDDTLCRYGYTPAGDACLPTALSKPIPCVCYGSSACVEDETTKTLNDWDPNDG